ncbi:hypothetical protein EIP86_005073 [Pleurotus ostreatoroseus]|nr:hypothetical protein EIP86_005073 [Pleurotus ostreatoroseus]
MPPAEPERIQYYDGPQYLDTGTYKEGLAPHTSDLSLRSICGRYVWMYYNDQEEETLEDPESQFGYIKLSLARGAELTAENITGRIKVHEYEGEISLKQAPDRPWYRGNGLAGPAPGYEGVRRAAPGLFDVTIEWDKAGAYGSVSDMEEKGHCLTIGAVKDDHGCPFVWFELECGRSCPRYLGKRQKGKTTKDVELLSGQERVRLGIDLGGGSDSEGGDQGGSEHD